MALEVHPPGQGLVLHEQSTGYGARVRRRNQPAVG